MAVVLAIDTSGSMLPDNIERAKAAADAFATRMEPGTRMGVVAFSDQPVVVQELTSDLEQVRAAIAGLTAQGDTALYDAVIQSSELLGKEDAQRNLVLLSDGLHDGPPTTISQAIDAANKNGVDIYTVGLGPGGDENSANLERMAKETGGEAFSAEPEELERLYELLAHHAGLPVRRQDRAASRPGGNGELPAPGAGQRRDREIAPSPTCSSARASARRRYPPGRLRLRRCRGWRASRGATSSPSPGSPPCCWPACCCSGQGRGRAGPTGR